MSVGRLTCLSFLASAAFAQVSVTITQSGKPGPRSQCRIEICNLGAAPVQLGGGVVSQLGVLGGFNIVGAGEEERAQSEAEAGAWSAVRTAAVKILPRLIEAAAVFSVVKKHPIQVQSGLAIAALFTEMIPDRPRSTAKWLVSSEMIALPSHGCDVRYVRARTAGFMAPYHKIIGREEPPEPGETDGARFEIRVDDPQKAFHLKGGELI